MTQTEALAFTLAIEVPVVAGLTAWWRWAPGGLRRVLLHCVLASVVTHPLLWLADPLLSLPQAWRWALLEGAVVLVEAGIYAGPAALGVRRGLVLSLSANASSFGLGLLLFRP